MKQTEEILTTNNLAEIRTRLKVNGKVFYSLLLGDLRGHQFYGKKIPTASVEGYWSDTVSLPTTWQIKNFVMVYADVLAREGVCMYGYRSQGRYKLGLLELHNKDDIKFRRDMDFDIETGRKCVKKDY